MNKSYINLENYTIVQTDKGLIKRDTTSNIEELLQEENKLEILKKSIDGIIYSVESSKNSKLDFITELKGDCKVFLSIIGVVALTSLGSFSINLIELKEIKAIIFTIGIISLGFVSTCLTRYAIHKSDMKEIKKFEDKLESLNEEYEKQKQKVEKLFKQKSNKVEEESLKGNGIDQKIHLQYMKELMGFCQDNPTLNEKPKVNKKMK